MVPYSPQPVSSPGCLRQLVNVLCFYCISDWAILPLLVSCFALNIKLLERVSYLASFFLWERCHNFHGLDMDSRQGRPNASGLLDLVDGRPTLFTSCLSTIRCFLVSSGVITLNIWRDKWFIQTVQQLLYTPIRIMIDGVCCYIHFIVAAL